MSPTLSKTLLVTAVVAAFAFQTPRADADTSPVADAAMRKDAEAVRALLKKGEDVNAAQGDGMTALHWAASAGDTNLVQVLLYAGANLRAATRISGYTPLFFASQYGHAPVIDLLLKAGADPKAVSRTGSTPLMLAAASGNVDAARLLIDGGADVNARESARGQTALMFAAAYDRVAVIEMLAARGADLAAASKTVDLFTVSREDEQKNGQRGQAQAAFAGGRGARGGAPAQGSARGGRGAPAPQVPGVTRGYNYLELIGYQGGATALLLAAREGHLDSVRALLDAGADVNQSGPGHQTTALLAATINGHYDLATFLLDRGADPNLAAENGVTPLFAALNCEWAPKSNYPQPKAYLQQKTTYLELMTALLDKGADPNARLKKKVWYSGYNSDLSGVDEIGATPFWRAAYASDVPAMKLLVSRGADPHIATMKPAARARFGDVPTDEEPRETASAPPVPVGGPSVTPLQAASGVGYALGFAANEHRIHPAGWMPAVRFLVEELHADVNARDADGNTALHHAAARGDNEMIEYLVSKGADLKAVNRRGQNVADMANGPVQRTQPYPETLKLLESLGVKHNNRCVSC